MAACYFYKIICNHTFKNFCQTSQFNLYSVGKNRPRHCQTFNFYEWIFLCHKIFSTFSRFFRITWLNWQLWLVSCSRCSQSRRVCVRYFANVEKIIDPLKNKYEWFDYFTPVCLQTRRSTKKLNSKWSFFLLILDSYTLSIQAIIWSRSREFGRVNMINELISVTAT